MTDDDNLPKLAEVPREKPEWMEDVFGECWVERESGPNGMESVYYYLIQDRSFEEGWVKSDETRSLPKMR